MSTIMATKPWSPSPWTVGASRTLDERTPEAASASAARSEQCPVPGGGVGVGHVLLGRDRAGLQARQPGGDDERPVGALERRAERLDGAAVRVGGGLEVAGEGDVVLEGEVDDPVGRGGGGAQALEVVEAAAVDLGAGRGERVGRGVGAGEPDDLVARVDQLGDDGGADPAAGAGDEHAHE